ncbi:MAG: hypothetical protein JXA43_00250 [Candidatus Diapherotrites archaeon]|nr:hypothetical protein [Candidatus Diapherotrites archaeon]
MVNMIEYFRFMPKIIHVLRKHIEFENGHILFMDAPMCFIHAEGILDMQLEMYRQLGPIARRQIYHSAKQAGKKHGELALRLEKQSLEDLIKTVANYSIISGWGMFKVLKVDEKNADIEIEITESVMAKLYKKKSHKEKIGVDDIDWYVCGLFSGVLTKVLNRDMESIETHCCINDKDGKECRFRIVPKEKYVELEKERIFRGRQNKKKVKSGD